MSKGRTTYSGSEFQMLQSTTADSVGPGHVDTIADEVYLIMTKK